MEELIAKWREDAASLRRLAEHMFNSSEPGSVRRATAHGVEGRAWHLERCARELEEELAKVPA